MSELQKITFNRRYVFNSYIYLQTLCIFMQTPKATLCLSESWEERPGYVSPLCPSLWPLGFEERQRWPLKMATAKFVQGHSYECSSLSWLSHTSSYPTPTILFILPLPPTNSHGHAHALAGAPIAQMTPLIMYLRYLAPVKTALG